ncbi:hypothetical protein GX51_04689 [Blastomyces parvus]|uniref:Uncharacterized protein n=1 Tax=Blastomyces parvus TaxID=2060905 RepID=A0A2B7X0S5_9EURO|nr:hypothetical protein GX51_04689 [Blastomyces parvus]
MQATNKRKASDEEGQQEEHEEQRPRKLPERSSRASDINYDVREYYRGLKMNEKIYSTSSQKKDTPRRSGSDVTNDLDALLAKYTSTQRAVTPAPPWESCFECTQELCRNPRVKKCQKGPEDSKCRHCDATHKACVKIPQSLMPRLVKIQKIARSIIGSPTALGWSDEVPRREKRLNEESTIFQKEMENYIAGANMAISPHASHNVSGVSGSTAAVQALVNAKDPTSTAISGRPGSVKTLDKHSVITTSPSPFRAVKTESSFGSSPLFKTSPTTKMLIMPPKVTSTAATINSPPLFDPLAANSNDSNSNDSHDELKPPTPTRSTPELGQNPAPTAQIENQLRAATAESDTVGSSIKVAAEENATGDIQAASTDLNVAPFNLGAELLTVAGSIESHLARIADALEKKNRRGDVGDSDCVFGDGIIANQAYWE